jgi:hypothetical protein
MITVKLTKRMNSSPFFTENPNGKSFINPTKNPKIFRPAEDLNESI